MEKLGQFIKAIRNMNSINQDDLAEKIGINRTYLSKIENGKKTPTLLVIKSIAKELSIPVSILVYLAFDTKTDSNEIKNLREVDKLIIEQNSLILNTFMSLIEQNK